MPQYIQSDSTNAVGLGFEFYRLTTPQVWVAKRGSLMSGYNSYITMFPSMELAVITLSSGTKPVAETIGMHAMKILLPRVIDYSMANQLNMRIPSNPSLYEGTFATSGTDRITFTNGTNGMIMRGLFSIPAIRLDYVRNNTFVIDRPMVQESKCEDLFMMAIDGEVIHFISNGTMFNIVDIPGLKLGQKYLNTMGTVKMQTKSNAQMSTATSVACTKIPPLVDLPSTLPLSIQNAINIIQHNFTTGYNNTQTSAYLMIKYKNRILAEFGAGKTRNNASPTKDTLYRIASVTKVFTAVAVLIAQEQGFISMDDPLSKYDTSFTYTSGRDFTNTPTFKQMIIHMGGMSRGVPCDPTNCTFNYEAMNAAVNKDLQYTAMANSFPYYSNLGFTYAGRVLEKATNMTFEAFCQKYIFDPLNLTDTGFDINDTIINRFPVGRGFDMNTVDPMSYISLAIQAPSGQMYSSSSNLLSFFSCLTAPNCSILSKDARKQLFLPTFLSPDGLFSVGLGSFEQFRDEESGLWFSAKSGAIFGFGARPVAVPQLDLVMTILSSAQSPMVEILSTSSIPLIARAVLKELRILHQMNSALPQEHRSLIGVYSGTLTRFQVNHTISITRVNQWLQAEVDFSSLNMTNPKMNLYWTKTGLHFEAVVEDSACEIGTAFSLDRSPVTFTVHSNGGVDLQLPSFSYGSVYTQLPVVSAAVLPKLFLWAIVVCAASLL